MDNKFNPFSSEEKPSTFGHTAHPIFGQPSELSQANTFEKLPTTLSEEPNVFVRKNEQTNIFSREVNLSSVHKPSSIFGNLSDPDLKRSSVFGRLTEKAPKKINFIVNPIDKQSTIDQGRSGQKTATSSLNLFGGQFSDAAVKNAFSSSSTLSSQLDSKTSEASSFWKKNIQSPNFSLRQSETKELPSFEYEKLESNPVPSVFGGVSSKRNTTSFGSIQSQVSESKTGTAVPSYIATETIFGESMKPTVAKLFNEKHQDSSFFSKQINADPDVFHPSSPLVFENKATNFSPMTNMVGGDRKSLESASTSVYALEDFSRNTPKNVVSDKDIFGLDPEKESMPSPEKKVEATTLIAVNISDQYLHKGILLTHFRKYGDVKKILINKNTKQASIYFRNHESALVAKSKGKLLHPNLPELKLFLSATQSKANITKKDDVSTTKKLIRNKPKERPVISYEDLDQFPFSKSKALPSKQSKEFKLKSLMDTKTSFSSKFANKPEFILPKAPVPKVFGEVSSVKSKLPSKKTSKPSSEAKKQESSTSRIKMPSGNIATIKDTEVLMKSQAHNNYDRFLILDARDKNLRAKQDKVYNMTDAQYLLATCPDMCPEKERYSRDIQYDLSSYELQNSELCHKLSVKKFSRSSADKDEPLPHELRPGPVLKMTMDYLITNIIEEEREVTQLDVWYNYLCNRTRALRNDIMTQHLVDENAVYVLEKITRFHIHCSHHLCEEPADLFDFKMNAEHLTKSLHSLKESYDDLIEKGIFFDSEAEFRCYDILVNANDGNIIFQYLKFRESVRNSEPVNFATAVHLAIQSNNYVKFFKLLTKATYLQACVMHRHFLTMRVKALSVIVKAYSLPKEVQVMPSASIKYMLGFDDEVKFKSFMQSFGLHVTGESKIIINRVSFISKPENFPIRQKSVHFVEDKKGSSTGIVIQGGPLPSNPLTNYVPHTSFNNRGFLTQAALNASDQLKVNTVAPCTVPVPTPIIEETNNQIQDRMMWKVDEMHRLSFMKNVFKTWRQFTDDQINARLQAEANQLRLMSKVIDQWRSFAFKRAEQNAKVNKFILSKYFNHIKYYTVVSKHKKDILAKCRQTLSRILSKKYFFLWKKAVQDLKRQKKIASLRTQIIARKFCIQWRLKTILSIFEKGVDKYYKMKLLKSTFLKLKSYVRRKKSKRQIDSVNFPATGSHLTPAEQNKLLCWGYNRDPSLNMTVLDLNELVRDIVKKCEKHKRIENLHGWIAWSPLPFRTKFLQDINEMKTQSSNDFRNPFRIVLLIDSNVDDYFKQWIETKMDLLDRSFESPKSIALTSRNNWTKFIITVEKQNLTSSSIVDDASVVIFICNERHQGQYNNMASRAKSFLFLCKGSSSFEDDCWTLTKQDIDNPETSEKLFEFVYQQWRNYLEGNYLKCYSLQDCVQSFVSKKVLGPLFHTASKVLLRNKPFLSSSTFISFYNDALVYLSRELKCSGASAESYRIQSYIVKAILPELPVENWLECENADEILTNYLQSVADKNDWSGSLYSEVRKITKVSSGDEEFKENCSFIANNDIIQVPCLDVINCCIFYKMSFLPVIKIVYDPRTLDNYDNSKWLNELKESELLSAYKAESIFVNETPKKRKEIIVELPKEKRSKKNESRLLQELAEEKLKFQEFESKLQDMDEIDDELKYLSVLYNCD